MKQTNKTAMQIAATVSCMLIAAMFFALAVYGIVTIVQLATMPEISAGEADYGFFIVFLIYYFAKFASLFLVCAVTIVCAIFTAVYAIFGNIIAKNIENSEQPKPSNTAYAVLLGVSIFIMASTAVPFIIAIAKLFVHGIDKSDALLSVIYILPFALCTVHVILNRLAVRKPKINIR